MNKSFFVFICGWLMCAATMTAQLSQEDNDTRYYRELQVESRDGKFGLRFRNEVVVPYGYDSIIAQKNIRGFISKQGDKYGIIGVEIINMEDNQTLHSDYISRKDWVFLVEKGTGKKKRDLYLTASVVPCEFDEIKTIDGKYWVRKGKLNGIYNMYGVNILRCEFDGIEVADGKYWVSKGNRTGIYNMYGVNVLRCEFDDIKAVHGKYWVRKGKLNGIYNMYGVNVLRCEFDKIELTSDGKYLTYKDGKKSLYNSTGILLQKDFDFDVVYSTN